MITPYNYEVPTLTVVHTKPRHPIQVHIKQTTKYRRVHDSAP